MNISTQEHDKNKCCRLSNLVLMSALSIRADITLGGWSNCNPAGEASIITLSAPFIDDVAPQASVSLWFAILSIAPPIGVAVGQLLVSLNLCLRIVPPLSLLLNYGSSMLCLLVQR